MSGTGGDSSENYSLGRGRARLMTMLRQGSMAAVAAAAAATASDTGGSNDPQTDSGINTQTVPSPCIGLARGRLLETLALRTNRVR